MSDFQRVFAVQYSITMHAESDLCVLFKWKIDCPDLIILDVVYPE